MKMSLFKRKPKMKNPEVAEFIKGRRVRYVTSRDDNDVEYVLGRSGVINIYDGEIIIWCEGHEVFRTNVYEADMGELLSHDGVRIKGKNSEGKTVSVVAHYTARRQ
jgi:hypothetical protein